MISLTLDAGKGMHSQELFTKLYVLPVTYNGTGIKAIFSSLSPLVPVDVSYLDPNLCCLSKSHPYLVFGLSNHLESELFPVLILEQ